MLFAAPSEDTQVVLLLCSRLGSRDEEPRPLSRGEYNKLALALRGAQLRPGDLLQSTEHGLAECVEVAGLFVDRVRALLGRGAALGFAVESWSSRGLWVLSRGDDEYPTRLRERLSGAAPHLLFGAGDWSLLAGGGLAVVGSRNVDAAAQEFAEEIGARCASERVQLISGGARGVDSVAMGAALEAGGTAVGVLADSLARAAVAGANRVGLRDGPLVMISANDPKAGFSVGFAMERNKFMYALSDWALVVSSARGSGGTWTGAVENLKKEWVPLFVRDGSHMPEGNAALLAQGAHPFPATVRELPDTLREWLDRVEQTGHAPLPGAEVTPLLGAGAAFEQMHLLPDSVSLEAREVVEPPARLAASPKKGSRALTDEAAALLVMLPPRFRRSDLVGLCPGITPSRISALLSALKLQGLIEIVGGGGPVWRLTDVEPAADD